MVNPPSAEALHGTARRNAIEMSIADKQYYDGSVEGLKAAQSIDAAWVSKINRYFSTYEALLSSHFAGRDDVRVLELGAGICCLALLLSKQPYVSSVCCVDISPKKMAQLSPVVQKLVGGEPQKLSYREGDFNLPLEFNDRSFDLVVFDAALHHSRSIWLTLSECRRVLAKNGLLVAQRESFVPKWFADRKMRMLGRADEVRAGVAENAYLKSQYQYYLDANGFNTRFLPVSETRLQSVLAPFNGKVYSKWVIVAFSRDN